MNSLASAPDEISPLPPSFVKRTYGEPRFHTEGDIAALTFGAEGTVWAVDETGVLRQWSPEGKRLIRHFLSDLETLWCFGPQARFLASANDDLLIWNVADGQLLYRIAQPSWVTALAFDPTGGTVATGHDDGRVRFWDVLSQKLVGDISAHESTVSAISFSPDGRSLATASEDRLVSVWDAVTHKKLGDYASHTDRIPALTWIADGTLFVSAGWDTSARVWRPGQRDPAMLLNSHSDQVVAAAFAPKGHLLATADSDCDIHLWADPTRGTVAHVLRGHTAEILCLAFNADGTILASGGADRVVHLWDTATGQLIAGPNPRGTHGIAFLPDPTGPKLASTGTNQLRVWDVATGAEVTALCGGPAQSVAASADGRWLAAGGTDHVTRLWDLTSGSTPRALEATKPPISQVAFSPDGRMLAHTSPADGLVWLWETADGSSDAKLILIEAADGCTLEALAYHPDGQRVVVGGIDYLSTGERDGAVVVWNLESKQKDLVFDQGVYAIAVDPSGRYLAGAGVSDRVYLWDLTTEELVFDLEGHHQKVHTVAFSPDGSFLVSGSDDCTLRVWDVLSGRLLVVREFDSPVQSLAFDPDGGTLFAGLANTTCQQHDFKRLMDE